MKIEKIKYAIASKGFPLTFNDGDGHQTDVVENIYFYDSNMEAESALVKYYDYSNFQIYQFNITYEF